MRNAYRVSIGGGGSEWLCQECYDAMDEALGVECAAEQREALEERPEHIVTSDQICMVCDHSFLEIRQTVAQDAYHVDQRG